MQFASEFYTNIIGMDIMTYEYYLKVDKEALLSEDELKEFSDQQLDIRMLLVSILLSEKVNSGAIQFQNERDFQKQIHEAMFNGYVNNNFRDDKLDEAFQSFINLAEKFENHYSTERKPDSDKLTQAGWFCCKKGKSADKEDALKHVTFNSLVKSEMFNLKDYFNSGYKRVKIVS